MQTQLTESTDRRYLRKWSVDGRVRLELVSLQRPTPRHPHDVVVQVVIAGICRTDIQVARGVLPSPNPITLGHEFAGVVVACGEAVTRVAIGDRVTASPLIPCGACRSCSKGSICTKPGFLGVHEHGAYGPFVAISEENLHILPKNVSSRVAAYIEPIAATLAVMKADLKAGQRGVIWGDSRFARLAQRILAIYGVEATATTDLDQCAESSLDFAIETSASADAINALVRVLRAGGTLVLKSRTPVPVPISIGALAAKDLILRAVYYGRFAEAISLVSSGRLNVDDLFGRTFSLEQFESAFEWSESDESLKTFFAVSNDGVWPDSH